MEAASVSYYVWRPSCRSSGASLVAEAISSFKAEKHLHDLVEGIKLPLAVPPGDWPT